MNDNPNKEDIKRAEVDSARRHMTAKTPDEQEFYKRKLKSLKQHIKEAPIHPRVKSALDHAPEDLVLHSAKAAYRRLKGEKIDSGIKSSKTAKGSSRAVLNTREHDIVLDGKPAKVPGVLKMVHKGGREKYEGHRLGVHQNRAEGSDYIQRHATMVKQQDGTWVTNPKGVVAPVLAKGTGDKYLHMAHARNASNDDVKRLTKTDTHPDGISKYDFGDYVEYAGKKDLAHPIVKKFHDFHKATGVGDFHEDNLGIWTHPHTGEEHLVVRDAGFDDYVQHAYLDASFDYGNKKHSLAPGYSKVTRYVPLGRKKTQADNYKSFKKFVKEDWKRAAFMGAAATAAGACPQQL